MQKQNITRNISRIGRKSIALYLIILLVITSFVSLVPQVIADDSNVFITTYLYDGNLIQTTEFNDRTDVIVNVTVVDNMTGDPPIGLYFVKALNEMTGEWIMVNVTDNQSIGIPNTPNDGMYWGRFQINSTHPTQNASMPMDLAYLQSNHMDIINISEIPESPLDGDSEIAYTIIVANFTGPMNNPPNMPSNPNPAPSVMDVPIHTNLSWDCTDPDPGDTLTFDVYFGTSPFPPKNVSNQSAFTFNPIFLDYNTKYYWKIVAWDNHSASTISPIWNFTTEQEEIPPSGNGTVCGFVKDQNQTGIEGALVILVGSQNFSVSTSSNGYYFFNHNVSVGHYTPMANVDGHPPIVEPDFDLANNQTRWVNFTLQAGPGQNQTGNSTIKGYVKEQGTNDSIPNARVNVQNNQTFETVQTNGEGFYIFDHNITSGIYNITASKDGVFDPFTFNNIAVEDNRTIWQNFSVEVQGGESYEMINFSGVVYQDMTPNLAVEGVNITVETQGNPFDVLGWSLSDDEGEFLIQVIPNASAVQGGNSMVTIRLQKISYEERTNSFSLQDLYHWAEEEQVQEFRIRKLWNITCTIIGTVYNETTTPLEDAQIFARGDEYFENQSISDSEGNFSVGVITGMIEIWVWKNGYFQNVTELEITELDNVIDLGDIHLETIPPYSAHISGTVTCNAQPLPNIELMVYDPEHPFDQKQGMPPRTNATGCFNISTYPGQFYLVTLAEIIGMRMNGPPLGIGGYVNQVIDVVVAEDETFIVDIELTESEPDEILVNMNLSSWNMSTLMMVRTVLGNAEVVRVIADTDLNGVVSAEEAAIVIEDVTDALSNTMMYSEIGMFISFPFSISVDGVDFTSESVVIEASGLNGSASNSTDPIIFYVNGTYVLESQINQSMAFHSVKTHAYYANPAFTQTFTLIYPDSFTVRNARQELISFEGLGTSTAIFTAVEDPNLLDTTFYEPVFMFVGTSNATAWFNESYVYETVIDTDGDGKYNFLKRKVKFYTSRSGIFELDGRLRTMAGEDIDQYTVNQNYSSGSKTAEFWFEGEKIYKMHENGPYRTVIDLFFSIDGTEYWFDTINQSTSNYSYTAFDSPPIYFTGTITDYGSDTNDNGLYEYLIFDVEVDVGEADYYEFEGDVGITEGGPGVDQHIAHIQKSTTFSMTGIQTISLNVEGYQIYNKGVNSSLWFSVRVRTPQYGQLDSVEYMTDTYYYEQFELPPPENSSIRGNVTDIYGNPVSAMITLRDRNTWSENSTTTNGTGWYRIDSTAGSFEMEIWCTDPGANLDNRWEYVTLDEDEILIRDITMLPYWHMTERLDMWMENCQYAAGDPVNITIAAQGTPLPYSLCTLFIYREVNVEGFYSRIFVEEHENQTDENGYVTFSIDTSGFDNGDYIFEAALYNETQQRVCRDDRWVQINSLFLNFEIDKSRYRPGSNGTGTYSFTYAGNQSYVQDGSFEWMILYYDWMGEHTVTSGTFTSGIGHGTFTFTIPATINPAYWYDIRLIATKDDNEIRTQRSFGIATGTSIESVTDSAVGEPGNYVGLVVNVTINVTTAGTYRISGGLNDENWWWIAGDDNESYVSAGLRTLQLYFDGQQIRSNGRDPYSVWIGLYRAGEWNELDSLQYTLSQEYNYEDFMRPAVAFERQLGFTITPIGPVDNYDSLNITCAINSTTTGNYSVNGDLHYREYQQGGWWLHHPVAWANKDVEINETNVNTTIEVTLSFRGSEIYGSMQPSPWNINLNLQQRVNEWQWEWIEGWDPETEINYTYNQFTAPVAYIGQIIDNGPDPNGDLRITTQVNVSNGSVGNYEINAQLFSSQEQGHMWISQEWNQTHLENGTNNVTIIFSGESIYSAGYNGPYRVGVELRQTDPWQWLGYREEDTDAWNYTDFSQPGALFTGEHTDAGYDEDEDGFYDYLRITAPINFSETDRYEVSGELYKQVGYQREWITWSHTEFQINETGEENVTIDFSGYEIRNRGLDGEYGVTLRLRVPDQGIELGQLEFTADTYYYYTDFELPAVSFSEDSPTNESLSDDGSYLNFTLVINSSEVGQYHVEADLHKVINMGGWQQWIWLTHTGQDVTISETGTTEVVLSFDTATIQQSGYDGPYMVNFRLMDENWMMIDSIDEHETEPYDLGEFAPAPVEFTGEYYDYLSPPTNAQYVKVNISLEVNESGNYHIDGCLHKQINWNWNHLAGNGMDLYLQASNNTQNITLQFDVVEICNNIQSQGLEGVFDGGSTLDLEVWLRRSGQWQDLDHISGTSYNTYTTADFSNTAVSIGSVAHNGYSVSGGEGTPPYDFLNITVLVNFTVAGNYEVWCDLSKQAQPNWYWLGWTNEFVTITATDLIDGYEVEEIPLQFNGEQISSSEQNSPYRYHFEIQDRGSGQRVAMREAEISGYSYTDFVGSAVVFDDASIIDTAVDSDDSGEEYDYLQIDLNITSSEEKDVVISADLHKEQQGGWQWIEWTQIWETVDAGTNSVTLTFNGESIYNSGVNGPYQIRLELRDANTWSLLDTIGSYDTGSYMYTNFQQPGASMDENGITDIGNDSNSNGYYDTLDITIPVSVSTEGDYEISGDLHQDIGGWYWLGWESTGLMTLPEGTSNITLQFDGIQIRSAAVNGPYQAHIELRDDSWNQLDRVDRYMTAQYSYTEFEQAGIQIVDNDTCPFDQGIGTPGSYDYLELNITLNCSAGGAGHTYWLGADLHKESRWQWQWIDFQNIEFTAVEGEQYKILSFPGELISGSGLDGPYQIRIELRDTTTWTTQDMINRYETQGYSYTDFKEPSVFFVEDLMEDWGNDTDDADTKYNFLDLNVTINCSQAGRYWIHGNLHYQSGWMWYPISWEGEEITLDDSGEQQVKLQFSGEQIYGSGLDGPYKIRLELNNITTWMRYDVIEQYQTEDYSYTDFQSPSIEFVEDSQSPSDQGVGTAGSYTYLLVNVTMNSTTGGTYWLGADLHKRVGYNWIPITWQSQEITHTGSGDETFSILFEGSIIRNSGYDGPYELRLELRDPTTWNLLDMIDDYQTESYDNTDFQGAGIELVSMTNGAADTIVSGNLQLNITVNSSAIGTYELRSMVYKQEQYNWWYIVSSSQQITVDDSGDQQFSLTFDGEEIYNRGINGPYQIRIELWRTGTWTMIDSIDPYQTNTYSFTDFTSSQAGINETETEDYATETYLQVNVTTNSATSTQYQVSGWLCGENWEYIAWNEQTQTIQGYNQTFTLQFDGSIINNSHINPDKVYIEMRRTSDGRLIDSNATVLQGSYDYNDFSSGVEIDVSSVDSDVWDADGDLEYDTLNVTLTIDFTTEGSYAIIAGLTNQTGTWITGASTNGSYSGPTVISLVFNGLDIYAKARDGPYVVSFISVVQAGVGEIARVNNVHTTDAYAYTAFQHPDAAAHFTGTYSGYASNVDGDDEYEYLIINVAVDIGVEGDYDFYGDLYADGGDVWVDGDDASANLETGVQIIQLKFEGDAIYSSLTDGPYILGYVRVSADIDGSPLVLDSASNVFTITAYEYTDFESEPVEPLAPPENVQSISVSNDPFSPNADSYKDTTSVTVTADASQTLYLNIYNSENDIKRTGLALSGVGTTYTATWNGKDDSNTVVTDDTYRIKVSTGSYGDPSNEATETTTVVVDNTAPTGATVTINNGDSFANSTSATLTLTGTDVSNKKMRFKNSVGDWSDWEDYQTSKSWTLYAVDGVRTVYYQVKDVAGNTATAVSDTVTLDTVKPTDVSVTISGSGDTPTTHSNSVSVTLAISASDATSGLYQMMLSNDITFTGQSWETYSTSKSWTLTSGDGVKTVYLKVKDYAGLIADVVSDNITLDTTAPTSLTVSIASGQTYTNSTTVTVSVSATGAAKMRFSRNGTTYTTYETYATSKTWTLVSGDGTKTVYFQAKDTAGNTATAVTDTIILDTTAPTFSSITSTGLSQTGATITWTTSEVADSQVQYGLSTSYGSNSTLDTSDVTSHSVSLTSLTPGTTYHYRVKSRDQADNLGTSTDYTFATTSGTDTTPPNAITGLTVRDKTNAEKTLTLSWTQSSATDFSAYKIYRRTSSFTNVTASGVQLLTTITEKTTTTYDDTSATDDTTFYYAVTAIDTASPPNENKTVTSVSGMSYDDKKPATTDNIPTGWQRSAVTVTLTAVDNGKGVNKTYYTTDGTNPTNTSNQNRTQYTSPFTIGGDNDLGDDTYTIMYYSYDKNTTPNIESTHTKTLKVDTVAPITSISRSPTGTGWKNTAVTITLSATDDTSGVYKIRYTTDGSSPTNSSTQYTTPLLFSAQGNTTLKYRAKDNATNTETPNTAYIKIDTSAPTSSITALSTYSTTPFDVSWAASDTYSGVKNVTIQIKNGTGGTWTNYTTSTSSSGTLIYNGAVGSTYYFRSIAKDNVSNTETASTYDTYTTIVTSAPTVDIASPTDDDGDGWIYVKDTVTITGNATDTNFNKYWLNYSADEITWTTITSSTSAVENDTLGSWNTSALDDGNYTLNLTARNIGGVRNWITLDVTVDNTLPELSSISSGTPTASSATITWTTDEDANSTVEYGLTDSYGSTSTSSTYTTSHSRSLTSLSASTTYHYRVISYDKAGNQNTSSDDTFTTAASESPPPSGPGPEPPVTGGDTPPTISGISHTPTTITSNNYVTIYATVTDNYLVSLVTLYWNDGSNHSRAMTKGTGNDYVTEIGPFLDGITVNYWIIAQDNASQTTRSATYSFTVVDGTGPTITNLHPTAGTTTNDRTPTIQATYTDPSGIKAGSITIRVDGTNVTSSATITLAQVTYTPTIPMSYTTHTITVTVSDTYNNQATKTWTFTVQEEITKINETIENLTKGDTQFISLEHTATGIDSIEITAAGNLIDVTISVESLTELPKGILEPTANVYCYLTIETTAEEGSIETFTITFKVEQEWFTEHDIDKTNIVLMRYHNNQWEQLETTIVNEDDMYVYYKAVTTGLSTFAIAAQQPPILPTIQLPFTLIAVILGAILAIIIVIVVLFKAGFIYIDEKPKDPQKTKDDKKENTYQKPPTDLGKL
ncbi:MAG: PGF-pre-PGF domain-containing protein [Methanobacteriota archaeon]